VSIARSLRRLIYAVVLSCGAAGAIVVTLGTQASASPSKVARIASGATSQTVVNSATPTTGPVPTTCAGPTVNSNGTITLCLTAPQATNVQLNFQNMLGLSPAADAFPMTQGSGGIWYITVEPPAGANWYGYNFTVDGAHVADPDNRDIWTGTPGSFSSIGAWSMVMVPGDTSQYMANTNVPHGAVATVNYYSTLGQTDRRMTIYTPPNYNRHHRYPVLYLMHGAGGNDTDWVVNMRANFILDNLIAQHKVKPMIVVMPDTNVGSTGGLNGSVTADQFIQQELLGTIVPYTEHNYRTLPGARNRALAGLSMGSFHTRNGLFTNPTDFSYYGLFSNGALFPATIADLTQNHPDLIRGVARAERQGVIKEIWISQGNEEPQAIAVLANALQPTLTFFDQNGIKYSYVPCASIGAIYGHVWDTWRKDLVAFAPTLFRESGRHTR
jgi:enterochelin esterase-like enzyme